MALMLLTNTSVLTPSETFSALVRSTRGQVLIVAVVLLSALYPKFGFIRRQEIGSLRKNREQILNAFVSEGFKPVRESEHEMVFRADSLFKRLTLLFEDEIRVTQTGEWITIEGIRRGVARVYYRHFIDSLFQQCNIFVIYTALHAQFSLALIGCQIGTNGKQLILTSWKPGIHRQCQHE